MFSCEVSQWPTSVIALVRQAAQQSCVARHAGFACSQKMVFCRGSCTGLMSPSIRREREFFIDNLLVRVHRCFWCTGLAPWEFKSPFPGSLISTFLGSIRKLWSSVSFPPSLPSPGKLQIPGKPTRGGLETPPRLAMNSPDLTIKTLDLGGRVMPGSYMTRLFNLKLSGSGVYYAACS
jgi:hypothetical protein